LCHLHLTKRKSDMNKKQENKHKNKIIRVTLLVIGTISLIGVIFLQIVTNPTIGFILQAIISTFVILYAIFFNKIPKKLHICILIVCLIPVIFVCFLGIYGNMSNVDYREDAVIVLGAGVRGETVSINLAHRLDRALEYWNENPEAVIVVTGGLGELATITEAEAMARYLIARGVPQEKILLEGKSTSTYENLTFAKEILGEHLGAEFRVVVISNDFHIFRAVRIARQVGLDATGKGAYTLWYTRPANYLREMLAVINMWLF